MASEVKRPVRPFRRKSDVPLSTNQFLEEESQLQQCNELKTFGVKPSADPGSSEILIDESLIADVVGDQSEDSSLKIIEEDLVTRPVRPPRSVPDGQKVTPISRPLRPKERHKTLSSQFPMLELREKTEKEEMIKQENKRDARYSLTENHVSTVTAESSSSKPLVKPKPVLHSFQLQSTNHELHCPGLSDADGQTAVSQSSGVQNKTEHNHENKTGQGINQQSNDQQNPVPKSMEQPIAEQPINDRPKGSSRQDTSQDRNKSTCHLDDDVTQQKNCQENAARSDNIAENYSHSSHEMNKDLKTAKQEDAVVLSDDTELSSLPTQQNAFLPEAAAQKVDVPVYAEVDRTKKLKNMASDSKAGSVQPSSDLVSTDASSSVGANVSVVPPKKPPRTFAHTEYLRLKTAGKECCSGAPSATTAESEYEEIEQPVLRSNKPVINSIDRQSSRNSFTRPDGEESRKSDPVKRRSTGDKLPAPPRPPPPSIVQKTGTLSLKKDRELSPGLEAFQRGAPNFRNSDRGFWEKRKSKSPDPAKLDVHQKKSSEKKQKTKLLNSGKLPLHGKVEEDIYAEPDTLNNAAPVQSSADSPVDDPLYEVPSLIRKQQVSMATANMGGCPLPDAPRQPLRQAPVPCASMTAGLQQQSKNNTDTKPVHHGGANRQPMQAKISSAYSILRLNVEFTDSTHDSHDAIEEDSDAEVTKDEQERRLKHVSNVRKQTVHLVANYVRAKLNEPNQLFHFALIVGLQLDENKKCHPIILFQYPEKLPDGISADRVELFCFPDAEIWRPVTIYDGEMFSFVLTNHLGMRQYGYCRRLLPPGCGNRLPAALCIVSSISEVCMYDQLLRSVEDRFMVSEEQAQDLLRSAYSQLCPDPNREVFIVAGPDCKKQPVIIRRSGESRSVVVSCDSLLTYLSINTLIKVFASVLLERRLVFCAQKLSSLTSCVHTILSLLYPFEWQHIFIPVLPSCMTEILDSPTPYVIGILSSTYAKLLQNEALSSEILVVDLDGGSLLHCHGDEQHIIPEKLQKALSIALKDDSDSIGVRDTAVTEAFLRFFIETCGHYTDFISAHQDSKLEFDVDQFTSAVASRSIQMFLEWFVRTQMFEVFVTEELHGVKHEHFLLRIMEYREEMTEMTSSLKQNMKMMRKKIKHFFVESGGKLRRKFQRNVFI